MRRPLAPRPVALVMAGAVSDGSEPADGSEASGAAGEPAPTGGSDAHDAEAGMDIDRGTGDGKDESLMKTIEALRAKQKAQRAERQAITKQLKNAQQRKRRLKARARQLSNEDLMAVLLMREEAAASASTKAGGALAAAASSSSASSGSAGAARGRRDGASEL